MLTVTCPRCNHHLGIPDQFTGEIFRCKQCGTSFRVAPPPPPAPEPAFGVHVEEAPAALASPAGSSPGNPLVPLSAQQDPNTVRFSCPRCKAGFESPASQAGTKFHCSSCGQRIQVPSPPPNKTVLGNLDTAPVPAPQSLVPQPLAPQPAYNPNNIPVAQYDNTPRMPNISINVNTTQPLVAQPAPPPPRPRPYRRYDDGYGYGPQPPPGGASMGLGITSMVLGIVALPFAIFPCLGILSIPIAGLAVVLGLIGLVMANSERGASPGFAIAGLVTGGGAILLALIWLLAWRDAWGRRAWWW